IDRANTTRHRADFVTAGMNRGLVRNGDVASGFGFLQLAQDRSQVGWRDVERLVFQRDPGRTKRGVLKQRRERVTHRMTEQHQPPRISRHLRTGSQDFRRSNSFSSSRSRMSAVSRYASRSPPYGSVIPPLVVPDVYSSITWTLPRPPSARTCSRWPGVMTKIK